MPIALIACLGLALFSSAGLAEAPVAVQFEPVAAGLDRVTGFGATPALPDLVWVSEQVGRLRLLEFGTLRPLPFLDLTDRVLSLGFEQGLTGFALAPAFPANPTLFVHYIRADHASVVARFRLLPGPVLAADPASEAIVLTLVQPHPTHNCNDLRFGPDGYLYIGCGDGGPPFTPVYDPQALNDRHGKLLRIDVNNVPPGQPYGIPADNPFIGTAGAAPEVWALGLRNPYRFSFDPLTGDLWLGDVGQSTWEEINLLPAGTPFGVNFGWNRMEGAHCYPIGSVCDHRGMHLPLIEYSHDQGCAVIGGVRLRNGRLPALEGAYLYADFCTADVFAAEYRDAQWQSWRVGVAPGMPTSFGVTARGELWLGTYGVGTAAVYRLVPRDAIFADGFDPLPPRQNPQSPRTNRHQSAPIGTNRRGRLAVGWR